MSHEQQIVLPGSEPAPSTHGAFVVAGVRPSHGRPNEGHGRPGDFVTLQPGDIAIRRALE